MNVNLLTIDSLPPTRPSVAAAASDAERPADRFVLPPADDPLGIKNLRNAQSTPDPARKTGRFRDRDDTRQNTTDVKPSGRRCEKNKKADPTPQPAGLQPAPSPGPKTTGHQPPVVNPDSVTSANNPGPLMSALISKIRSQMAQHPTKYAVAHALQNKTAASTPPSAGLLQTAEKTQTPVGAAMVIKQPRQILPAQTTASTQNTKPADRPETAADSDNSQKQILNDPATVHNALKTAQKPSPQPVNSPDEAANQPHQAHHNPRPDAFDSLTKPAQTPQKSSLANAKPASTPHKVVPGKPETPQETDANAAPSYIASALPQTGREPGRAAQPANMLLKGLKPQKIQINAQKGTNNNDNSDTSSSPAQLPHLAAQQTAGHPMPGRTEGAAGANLPQDVATGLKEQLNQSIHSSLQQNGQEITVRLNPPELGRLSIKFEQTGTELKGLLQATRAETRAEIQNAIPHILKSLQAAGIHIKSLDVTLNDMDDSARQHSKQQWFQNSWSAQNNSSDSSPGRSQHYPYYPNSPSDFAKPAEHYRPEPQEYHNILAKGTSLNLLV